MVELLVATAVGGGTGYVLTILAGKMLGATNYATFAVFWSALYLVVGAVSGVQQEVARATRPRRARTTAPNIALRFGAMTALALLGLLVATSPLWAERVFRGESYSLALPLAIGVAWYSVMATLAGVFYGLELWKSIATLVSVDGLLRLALVGCTMLTTDDVRAVAWAIVLPFFVTPIVLWLMVKRLVRGRFELDVGFRALTWNVARTVTGSAATGVVVSGFPLLLGATSSHESVTTLAAILFAANIIRAPIIVVVMALQSYLIIMFRTRQRHWGLLGAIVASVGAGTAVIAILAGLFGPSLLQIFMDADFVLPAALLANLVGSAGVVAVLCATGPALIAIRRHAWYTSGWVVAAIATVLVLFAPLDLVERATLALWCGPLVGLGVHLVGLAGGSRNSGADLSSVGGGPVPAGAVAGRVKDAARRS